MVLEFVVCENCDKTMPKQETGIELLDNMTPAKVWCSQICLDEWEEKQRMKSPIVSDDFATAKGLRANRPVVKVLPNIRNR